MSLSQKIHSGQITFDRKRIIAEPLLRMDDVKKFIKKIKDEEVPPHCHKGIDKLAGASLI